MLKAARILAVIGKVFAIISIVLFGISALISIFSTTALMAAFKEAMAANGEEIPDAVLAILPVIIVILFVFSIAIIVLNLVFTNQAIKRLDNHEAKSRLIAPAILMIIFSSTFTIVAGILLLAAPARAYENN